MAPKLLAAAVLAAAAGAASAHSLDAWMSTKTVAADSKAIEVPPSGGSRPVGSIGTPAGTVRERVCVYVCVSAPA